MMDYFKTTYRRHNAWSNGPGGWNCPCCGPIKKDRPLARRAVRRIQHLEDKKLLQTARENSTFLQ
jgi:hypothetical protein